jgi:predicted glycoside hydrolase/deacetylase ChbG (UPF0249 family)
LEKYLIVNADDFGASHGVNRGVIDCHTRGILTSEYSQLAVGLHWDVFGEDEREFDLRNTQAIRDEFHRQLDQFHALMGRMPSHIDSHRHAHRYPHVMPIFHELVEPLGLPLRDACGVRFVGKFYAQWEWNVTELSYVSVPFLQKMIRNDVQPGFTEFSCHPGYVTPDYRAVYLKEREYEAATLVDPVIRQTITEEGIHLISYDDYSGFKALAVSLD